ncbi:MAG: energy transducer TonB, partial [Acidobacteriaceae bacterium]
VTPTPSHAAAPAPPKGEAPPVSRAGSPAGSPHAAPAPAKAPPLPTQPVPVDPVIAGTMKISGDPPPDNARIQGVVVVALTVGADGAVQSVQAVSGPGLLELAALNTVRSWRYRPWLVEGHPVPFTTQVVFNYTFGSPSQ